MADTRTYIKVHDGMPEHPKFVAVGGDAGWLHICAMGYCSRYLTDGILPAAVVPRISDRKAPGRLAKKLIAADVWHADGHGCGTCAQPGPGNYVLHDYLEHQRSAEAAETLREKRRSAGSRGGKTRANNQAKAKQMLEQELPEHDPELSKNQAKSSDEATSEVVTRDGHNGTTSRTDQETPENTNPQVRQGSGLASGQASPKQVLEQTASIGQAKSKQCLEVVTYVTTQTEKNHQSSQASNSRSRRDPERRDDDDPLDFADLAKRLEPHLGPTGPAWAQTIAERVLSRANGTITSPAAYVLAAVARDPDAYRQGTPARPVNGNGQRKPTGADPDLPNFRDLCKRCSGSHWDPENDPATGRARKCRDCTPERSTA